MAFAYKQGGAWVPRDYPPPAIRQANRRRLFVFLGTLAATLVIGLGFTWLRPAEYRASARIEIIPGTESTTVTSASPAGPVEVPAAESPRPFFTEVQVLTSRPVLQAAIARVERDGERVFDGSADPVAAVQSHLQAIAVPNTNVVELVATGPRAVGLAPLLTAIIDIYRERLADAFRDSSAESTARAKEEVDKLNADLASKRRELDAFRLRHNIVSLERDENVILAQTRSLSASLGNANENVAKAEGKLRALESPTSGSAVKAKDDPTLANLEQRASQLREQLNDFDRDFTPDYLAKDPRVVGLRSRLTELERQIMAQREIGRKNALADARDELASAQGTAARIQNQIASGQKELQQFTTRFNEYKSQQEQLNAIETAYQDASRRLAKHEATLRARTPTLNVLEVPATPREPWRPNYWRDTAVALAASLLLALLVMWLVELFNRTEPPPSVVVLQGQVGGLAGDVAATPLGWQGARTDALGAPAPALLAAQPDLPRELGVDEVTALVNASDDNTRLAVLLLLSGISPEEMLRLRWSDIEVDKGRIHIQGESMRDVALPDGLRAYTTAHPPAPSSDLVFNASSRDTIRAQLLCGAHDAGIESAVHVTPDCVRHTYIAFLVRQGIRFADLTAIVGHLPAEVLGAYSALSPRGARISLAEVNVAFPLRLRASAGGKGDTGSRAG